MSQYVVNVERSYSPDTLTVEHRGLAENRVRFIRMVNETIAGGGKLTPRTLGVLRVWFAQAGWIPVTIDTDNPESVKVTYRPDHKLPADFAPSPKLTIKEYAATVSFTGGSFTFPRPIGVTTKTELDLEQAMSALGDSLTTPPKTYPKVDTDGDSLGGL